jgi:hypothetical protein
MNSVKELVLRKFGDQETDTFGKHWAKIEYTSYLCTHLILPSSRARTIDRIGYPDIIR